MSPTELNTGIRATVGAFLADWDRQAWMQEHGEWASSRWDDARFEYDAAESSLNDALETLESAIRGVPASSAAGADAAEEVEAAAGELVKAVEAFKATAKALEDQIRPDDNDYIATGLIDPDCVADSAITTGVDSQWAGWDCLEGWSAYRSNDALYLRWWRAAYGNRHDRDLWVLIDSDYFTNDKEDHVSY